MPPHRPRALTRGLVAAALTMMVLGALAPAVVWFARDFQGPGDRPLSRYLSLLTSRPRPRWNLPGSDSEIARLARLSGTRPALLKGVALALNSDPDATTLTMDLSPGTRELLVALGEPEALLETPEGRLEAVGRGLAALEELFGGEEAVLVALVAGVEPATKAVAQVQRRGLNPTYENLARRLPRALRRETNAVVPAALSLATAFDMDWPSGRFQRVSSAFGMRIHPVKGTRRLHAGIDIPMPCGTPVTAAASGKVLRAGYNRVSGWHLIIDHGRGVTSAYMHNDKLLVRRGERVHRDQAIALSGNTGRTTGPHLHYEVAHAGTPVDPFFLYRRGELIAAADKENGRAEALLQAPRRAPSAQPSGLLAVIALAGR